jgi:hypothetical protein
MLMGSDIINVLYSIALRFKGGKLSCTLLESNELIGFEKLLNTPRGVDGVLAPTFETIFDKFETIWYPMLYFFF